jgi:hypothetical protein
VERVVVELVEVLIQLLQTQAAVVVVVEAG